MIRIGLAADHGGFELKKIIKKYLQDQNYSVSDFGATKLDNDDDYPDFVVPLAKAIDEGKIDRGIAICGSGVGACIAANKIHGVRAALIHEIFSARQGVEDDNMNLICLGGRVTGYALAMELVKAFMEANYKPVERFERRLKKIAELENKELS